MKHNKTNFPTMSLPPKRYVNVSSVWFFTKLGILCALSIIAIMQGFALLQRDGAAQSAPTKTTQAPKNKTPSPQAAAKPGVDGRVLPKTREQVRQELAEIVNKQREKLLKKPIRPPLHAALMETETYALIKGEFIRRLDGPYGKLYKQLALDNDRLQKLRGLLAEKELGMLEGYELARAAKIPLGGNELATLRAESDGAIRELLGDAAFASYKNYENTLATRNHVTALEQRLSYKAEPLTNGQYDALVASLSGLDDPGIKPGRGAWLGNYSPEITTESLEIAKGILTPFQFAVYETEYERVQSGHEIEKEYSKKFANAEREHREKLKTKVKKREPAK